MSDERHKAPKSDRCDNFLYRFVALLVLTTARPRLLLTLCAILLLTGCGGRMLIPTPSV